MFALALTGLGAGGFHCRVNDLGVSLRGNHCLCHENLIADRAMLALGLAGFGAGRFDCRVYDLGVSRCGNDLLCNDDRVADGAMLALGLAGCGASSFNSFVDHLGMTRCGDFLNSGDRRAADRAFDARRMTGFRAGCGLFSNINGSMTGSSDCFCFGFVADRAGVGLDTGIFTGRSGRDLALIPLVSRCGNFLHAGESLAADRAFFAGFVSGLGAGCGLLGNFNRSMSSCVDCFGLGCIANRAGVGLDAGIFTGRSGRDLALIPLVSRCGNFLHAGESLAADRAFFAGFVSGLGAGCGLLGNFNRSMSSCVDCFGLGCIANRAGVGLDAGILTGRRGRDLALVPAVSLRGNLFCFGRIADRAGKGLYALVFAGRFGRDLALVPAVFLCRNNLTVADLLIAVLAVGIAGISGLGASGGFRVADLGVLM